MILQTCGCDLRPLQGRLVEHNLNDREVTFFTHCGLWSLLLSYSYLDITKCLWKWTVRTRLLSALSLAVSVELEECLLKAQLTLGKDGGVRNGDCQLPVRSQWGSLSTLASGTFWVKMIQVSISVKPPTPACVTSLTVYRQDSPPSTSERNYHPTAFILRMQKQQEELMWPGMSLQRCLNSCKYSRMSLRFPMRFQSL